MLRLFICLLILLNINAGFVHAYHIVKQNPVYRNYNNDYYYLPRENLSALEKYTLNRAYPRENPVLRLERLENLAFGSIQSGDLETRYKKVENAILSRPKAVTKKSALGNIVSYFAGQPTGITPPVYNSYHYPNTDTGFYNYHPSYGNQRYNQYSNGIFGHGYSLMNSGFGNGSSVTILP